MRLLIVEDEEMLCGIIAKGLRASGKMLILSARAEMDDRILGLDKSANDYLTKPFDFGEWKHESGIYCAENLFKPLLI